MLDVIDYQFTNEIRTFKGAKATWYYTHLPKDTSDSIKFYTASNRRGWGAVPVNVTVGNTTWKTSIFPDKKSGCYLLFFKADVRKKEHISEGSIVDVRLEVGGGSDILIEKISITNHLRYPCTKIIDSNKLSNN